MTRSEARLFIVTVWRSWHGRTGGAVAPGRKVFADLYNAGELSDIDAQVLAFFPTISANSLGRWDRAEKRGGAGALADAYGNRRGDTLIDRNPDIASHMRGLLCTNRAVSPDFVADSLATYFPDHPQPSRRTIQRWLARVRREERAALTDLKAPDKYRSHIQIALGSRSEGIVRPNQLWEIDSTIGDVMLVADDGDEKRFAIIQIVDVYSRRAIMHVSRTSTAASVAATLRKAILKWGVPERIKMDNGADYTSRAIETILQSLEIEREVCPPFTPEAKPHVERSFGSFQRYAVAMLPGFVGHDVAARKDIEAEHAFAKRLGEAKTIRAKVTVDDFQAVCDGWCDAVLLTKPHGGLNGKTPFQMAAGYKGTIRHIADERALDLLLLSASGEDGIRTITKKGLRVGGSLYIHEAFGAMVGDEVRVLTDVADLGHVYVFSFDRHFVCEAICPERRGISAAEIAAAAKARQQELRKAARAELKKTERSIDKNRLVQDVLEHRAAEAGKLIHLGRTIGHDTAALRQAGIAAGSHDYSPQPETAAQERAREAMATRLTSAEITTLSQRHVPKAGDAEDRFARALRIEDAMANGGAVSEGDTHWLARYSQSAEYRSRKRLTQSFGTDNYARMGA